MYCIGRADVGLKE